MLWILLVFVLLTTACVTISFLRFVLSTEGISVSEEQLAEGYVVRGGQPR